MAIGIPQNVNTTNDKINFFMKCDRFLNLLMLICSTIKDGQERRRVRDLIALYSCCNIIIIFFSIALIQNCMNEYLFSRATTDQRV